MIRVLIVDDSPFLRRILKDILQIDDSIIVVGEAKNGKEAIDKIYSLKPDVVTLDVEMPVMDGITSLKYIIRNFNIPVIMLSSFTKEGAQLTLKALEEGAFDFIPKPTNIFKSEGQIFQQDIINKIKAAARSNIKANLSNCTINKKLNTTSRKTVENDLNFENLIVIGASTGGPRALQSVIPLIPKNINASIAVVQHMPPKFTKSLADRLNSISEIEVLEGEDNLILKRGYCYIAPGDYHMKIIEDGNIFKLKLDKGPLVKGLRPSVDVLMESASKLNGLKIVGVIMTGMGTDGANGIVEIKKSKGYIIAQDKESSIVFGMPKSAIATKCVDKVVPLNKIAEEIIEIVGGCSCGK